MISSFYSEQAIDYFLFVLMDTIWNVSIFRLGRRVEVISRIRLSLLERNDDSLLSTKEWTISVCVYDQKSYFTCFTSSAKNNAWRQVEREFKETLIYKEIQNISLISVVVSHTCWMAWTSKVIAGVVIGWRKSDVGYK